MTILRHTGGMAAHLDEVDRKILRALQSNARTSNSEIARQLNMAPSAILERIRKLEARGIITGYEARLAPKEMGLGMVAFISVRTRDRSDADDLEARLAKLPEVLDIHCVAGEDCYLVKARVADVDALRVLVHDKIGALDAVMGTRTTVVMGTIKETLKLPVGPVEVSSSLAQRVLRA